MLFYIKTNSFECISNPYTYSIKLLEKANNGNVTCLCSAQGNYGQSIMVKLTREGFETFDYFTNESNLKIPTVNLSNLIAAP